MMIGSDSRMIGAAATLTLTLACSGSQARQEAAAPAAPPAATVVAPKQPQSLTLTPEAMKTGGITVAAPRTERKADSFEAPAVLHVDETRTSRVGAIVDGVIVDANLQAGARVKRGARLAGIHSHMVHEALAEYRRALAERRKSATELAFMKEAEGRASRLLAAKAASRQEAERARVDRAAAEEAQVIADSEIERALGELEHLGITPDPAAGDSFEHPDAVPVTAPYGGVVLERLVTSGTAVTTGTPLYVVSDLSTLWAIAEVDESRLPALAVGREADLTVAAYPGRLFRGRIVAIGDTINPETRRVTARIEVQNRDGSLKPQMYATVRLPSGMPQPVAIVPAAAVQKIDQQSVVFVETSPGQFAPRAVTVGAERDGHVEIQRGLEANERIAITGTFLIKSKLVEGTQPE
jgi:membrane fusion protein, heavy metal efflux system